MVLPEILHQQNGRFVQNTTLPLEAHTIPFFFFLGSKKIPWHLRTLLV